MGFMSFTEVLMMVDSAVKKIYGESVTYSDDILNCATKIYIAQMKESKDGSNN